MKHAMEPVRFEQTDSRERGRAHGELWREPIAALADIRLGLTVRHSRFGSAADVRAAAAAHLPVLRTYLPELHAELLGIAEGSNTTPEDVMVLNQFADLCDVPPSALNLPSTEAESAFPEGSTAVYFTGAEGPVMGQTWDMHATAEPFLRLMSIEPRDSERQSLCVTLTGCLGLAGIGQDAVTVTANNLWSADGGVGVLWPAVVRTMIAAASAEDARERLLALPLSSGHYYTVADGRAFFGYESSGELKVLTQSGPRAAHLHANHCFDPVLRQREAVPRGSTTFARLNMATTLYAQHRPSTLDEMWALLGSREGAPQGRLFTDPNPEDESAPSTCGRFAARLRTGEVRVARGSAEALTVRMTRYNAPPELPPGKMSRFATIRG